MARPFKVSLDYFACDVHILDDPKIALVMAEHGPVVANVVIRLLGEIYGGEGYYLDWDDDRAALFAFNTCHGMVSTDEAKAIVGSLIRRGFFDDATYARTGKLTSRGIQARWETAIRMTHRTCEIDPRICLLERPKTVNSEETIVNSEETPVLSEKTPLNKIKEKKSNYKQTNQQTHACARKAGMAGGRYTQGETEAADRRDAPQSDPVRADVVKILVKPGDYSIDRDLIDRTVDAIRDNVPGLGPKDLQKISKKADAEVARYDRTDGRRGRQYRWQVIADEIHARFKSVGRPWDDTFAGENEPPPRLPTQPWPAENQTGSEDGLSAEELIAQLLDRDTDPAGETLEQTAKRLKCPIDIAYRERATWRQLRGSPVPT